MKIAELFLKDIARPINGVIKVGQQDDASVRQELEEYVVTSELDGHFREVFTNFANGLERPDDRIGIWVSGFFGSGKSHFLKIVSYLLGNQKVDGKRAIEFFEDGLKIPDAMLLADLKKSSNANADVILFNIDSKADSSGKQDKDSVVKVFQKVFDDHLGYFGTLPALANFERQLAAKGKYESFKTAFATHSGQDWRAARDGWAFERDTIVRALEDGVGMTAAAAGAAFDAFDKPVQLSVEGFAKTVNAYLEGKPKAQRIIFMVDEVGQYIGNDSKLMLNLQTVAEDLGVHAHGRAWVMVTSQEAMDEITKNMRGNDFSKIQGRFKHRVGLSSTNTPEVIKLRLLRKNETAIAALEALYPTKSAILKNLIGFTDAAEMPNYKDAQDFERSYPFVPYQFTLLQKVFTQIRIMGAAGKHLAEGERSLLDAFQVAARRAAQHEIGALVPFNAFYEAIQNFVDSGIRRVIDQATNNPQLEAFDADLLKTLFMIKYVKETPANIENLTVLHLSHIDEDKVTLRERITQSLARLEAQTLIQRRGERFEFLTNEEQDVGKEIKNQDYDAGEISDKLMSLAWDSVLTDRKFKYSGRYSYDFNRKLDDRVYGRQMGDLSVNLITPYAERHLELQQDQACLHQTMNGIEVLVRLPDNENLIPEVVEFVRTEKYLRRKGSTGMSPSAQLILQARGEENSRRFERIEHALERSLAQADVFVCGTKLNLTVRDARNVIQEGLRNLVENTYTKLGAVGSVFESEDQVARALLTDSGLTTLDGSHANAAAHSEMTAWITDQVRRQQPVTIHALLNEFGKRPYGWTDLDTLGVMAELVNAGQLELLFAQGGVDPRKRDLVKEMYAKSGQDKYRVRLTNPVDPAAFAKARSLAKDLFETVGVPTETPKVLALYRDGLTSKKQQFETWARLATERDFPFRAALDTGTQLLETLLKAESAAPFFTGIKAHESALEDLIENESKWRAFFEKQFKLFEATRADLKGLTHELEHIHEASLHERLTQARDILALPDPTSRIPNLAGLLEPVKQHLKNQLENRKQSFQTSVNQAQTRLLDVAHGLPEHELEHLRTSVDAVRSSIEQAPSLDAAIARHAGLGDFEAKAREAIIARINELSVVENTSAPVVKRLVTVQAKAFMTKPLETQADLDAYLAALRERLESELGRQHRVNIE